MLTDKQIWRLAWAVREAKTWIGAQPSKEEQDEYRFRIEDAEQALRDLRKLKKAKAPAERNHGPRGQCKVHGCEDPAVTPDGLCNGHFY